MKQSIIFSTKSLSTIALGAILNTLIIPNSTASTFTPDPIYKTVLNYETQIPSVSSFNGFDFTDIYYPQSANTDENFPLAVMLQGALVDKADYANFALQVASYGFVVAVPNHSRTLLPNLPPALFTNQEVVNDVLNFVTAENTNNTSPIEGKVDVNSLGLLGHSFGGLVGLGAIQNDCFPVICAAEFTRPETLKAGIFYSTRFDGQDIDSSVPPIFNEGIPTGLIGGTLDGIISIDKVAETYAQIQNPPKVLVTVDGANHYSITNNDSFRDPNRATLNQEIGTETIARWSGLFLRAHISEDREAFNYVYNFGDDLDSNVTVIITQVPESSMTWSMVLLGAGITIISIANNQRK